MRCVGRATGRVTVDHDNAGQALEPLWGRVERQDGSGRLWGRLDGRGAAAGQQSGENGGAETMGGHGAHDTRWLTAAGLAHESHEAVSQLWQQIGHGVPQFQPGLQRCKRRIFSRLPLDVIRSA